MTFHGGADCAVVWQSREPRPNLSVSPHVQGGFLAGNGARDAHLREPRKTLSQAAGVLRVAVHLPPGEQLAFFSVYLVVTS